MIFKISTKISVFTFLISNIFFLLFRINDINIVEFSIMVILPGVLFGYSIYNNFNKLFNSLNLKNTLTQIIIIFISFFFYIILDYVSNIFYSYNSDKFYFFLERVSLANGEKNDYLSTFSRLPMSIQNIVPTFSLGIVGYVFFIIKKIIFNFLKK